MTTDLALTGERTLPGIPEENYWFRRHEAAYEYLLPWCTGVVLEAGCGEGYGAAMLATTADLVVALDYDAPTTSHLARRYPELHPVRANLATLPLRSGTADVVASLQVIEHLRDQEGFLAECRRVLRPGGRLLVTTPNRLTFSPGCDTPLNPFHTRELAPSELDTVLRRAGFEVRTLAALHHGRRLRSLDAEHGGSLIDAQLAVTLDGGEWPRQLLTDVGSVSAADFEVRPARLQDRDGQHPERHDPGVQAADLDSSLDLVAVATAP